MAVSWLYYTASHHTPGTYACQLSLQPFVLILAGRHGLLEAEACDVNGLEDTYVKQEKHHHPDPVSEFSPAPAGKHNLSGVE